MTIKIALLFLEVATRRPLFQQFGFRLDQSQHAHFARSIAEIKGVHVKYIQLVAISERWSELKHIYKKCDVTYFDY